MLPTHVLISESAGGWLRLDLSASCSSTSLANSQVSAWHKKSGVDTSEAGDCSEHRNGTCQERCNKGSVISFADFLQPLFQAVLLTCASARSLEKASGTYGAEDESCSSCPGESDLCLCLCTVMLSVTLACVLCIGGPCR